VRYFVLRSPNVAVSLLARLDENDVEVSVVERDGEWRVANELFYEIVSDSAWQEIDADSAEQAARALGRPAV